MGRVFNNNDLTSDEGMLTTVWGPSMWHVLHTMSFNYPANPTSEQRVNYKAFILNMANVLPCRHCRENLTRNFKTNAPTLADMQNRASFSRYVYDLHETVNKMLKKPSTMTYADVRERYEHFRARCSVDDKLPNRPEKGCTEPLYSGKKAKCVLQIVPQEMKCETFRVDSSCLKTKLNKHTRRKSGQRQDVMHSRGKFQNMTCPAVAVHQ